MNAADDTDDHRSEDPGRGGGRVFHAATAQRPTDISDHATGGRRGPSFRRRMTLSFVIVAVITSLVFVIVLMVLWNNQFRAYTRDTLEELATTAATSLATSYNTRGSWNTTALQAAAASVSGMEDVGIQILNTNGVVLYDSTLITSSQNISALDTSMSLAPGDDSGSVVSQSVISNTGAVVGTVRVWIYGSDILLTQRDISFRNSSYEAIALAAIASIILAVVMGIVVSRILTRPIRTISNAAQSIKEGDLSARSHIHGNDDLGGLGSTFDAMAEAVERDRELERRLTADVAHELRTPLMSILATVEAMQDEVLPCDQEHLALVASETKRLSRLVDSMLRLSRLESGSVHMKIDSVDVISFVEDIAASHSALLEDAGLTMTFTNKTGLKHLMVELDRDSVTQALTNVISNSMRYTPAPGEVEVSVERDGDEVRIAVRDTGIGIAKEDLGNVFSRFWRAEESRSRVDGGLGIGLALTKEIVDHHHGRVEVDSEQGVGTTFTICLPISQPHHDSDEQSLLE